MAMIYQMNCSLLKFVTAVYYIFMMLFAMFFVEIHYLICIMLHLLWDCKYCHDFAAVPANWSLEVMQCCAF